VIKNELCKRNIIVDKLVCPNAILQAIESDQSETGLLFCGKMLLKEIDFFSKSLGVCFSQRIEILRELNLTESDEPILSID
jgi:hypothetical protein